MVRGRPAARGRFFKARVRLGNELLSTLALDETFASGVFIRPRCKDVLHRQSQDSSMPLAVLAQEFAVLRSRRSRRARGRTRRTTAERVGGRLVCPAASLVDARLTPGRPGSSGSGAFFRSAAKADVVDDEAGGLGRGTPGSRGRSPDSARGACPLRSLSIVEGVVACRARRNPVKPHVAGHE